MTSLTTKIGGEASSRIGAETVVRYEQDGASLTVHRKCCKSRFLCVDACPA